MESIPRTFPPACNQLPRAAVLGSLVALTLCFSGCAGPATWPPARSDLVWPDPPSTPRVRYVGAFHSKADLGIGARGLARAWEWIVGEKDVPLFHPAGIDVAPDGEIWVADSATRMVHGFSPERNTWRRIESSAEVAISSPIDVAVGADGSVFVSDSMRARVLVYDRDLQFVREIGAGVLQRPTGLAYDRETDRLHVVDTMQSSVAVFSADGEFIRWLARPGKGSGELHFPTHIAIVGDDLHITDSLNFRIQVMTTEGKPISAFGLAGDGPGTFSRPKGIAVDEDGHIWVADALFDNVQIFDRRGALLLVLGQTGNGPGEFYMPHGLAVDHRGMIYVSDVYNNRVQVFQYLREAPAS